MHNAFPEHQLATTQELLGALHHIGEKFSSNLDSRFRWSNVNVIRIDQSYNNKTFFHDPKTACCAFTVLGASQWAKNILMGTADGFIKPHKWMHMTDLTQGFWFSS